VIWIAPVVLVLGVLPIGAWIYAVYLLMPLASAVFLAFLFRLARLIGREDLARRCRNLFIVGFLFCGSIVGLLLFRSAVLIGELVGILISVGIVLLGICVFVAYANLINSTRLAIQRPEESQRFVGLM
jgi:hypothetical protein